MPAARGDGWRVAAGWMLPGAALAGWWLVCATRAVPPELLPGPQAVMRMAASLLASGEIWLHLRATLGRLLAGFALGAGAGFVAGSLTGASPLARRLLDPLLAGLRSVPSIAWVPLFIICLGIAEASKIALIAVGAFFPVYLNLMAGIAGADRHFIDVARIFGMGRWGVLRHVLWPASLPGLLLGLRGGLGLAWMFVAAAELMGASEGLGFLLTDGEQTGRPEEVILAIILFALLGRGTDLLLGAVAQSLLRGRR